MIKSSLAVLLFLVLVLAGGAVADQGRVLKVVDGDTFLAETEGKKGLVTIEVNLRCSDAPVLTSPVGKEAKQFLADLLGQSSPVHYKVLEFCGSTECVEALAYFPVEEGEKITYLNTRMIEAGMARNNNCRGAFEQAETAARSAKAGIWGTSQKIVYAEPEPQTEQKPEPTKTVTKKVVTAEKEAAAVIRYDRVERTVTIKSRKISLSRIIKTIDTVSPSPINLYLQNEQYIPINLENTHWYRALRYVVENADLKQVNLDGKIDLYTRLFYYKHVSPYLKVAGNVGVYMNAGSGGDSKELTRDDGTTRYVFINDFENSAEVAQQYRAAKAKNESSGFIQIHEGSGPAPVSDYGTFARSGESSAQPQAAAVEAVEEQVPAEPVEVPEPAVEESKPARAPLKPYSGEKVAAEQEEPVVVAAAPPEEPADPAPEAKQEEPDQQVPEEPVAETEAEETPAKTEVEEPAADQQEPASDRGEEAAQADREQGSREQTGGTQTGSAEKTDAGAPVAAAQLEFSLAHAVAILLIIVVVIIGCVYLTRSAGAKAAEAEKHVEPDDLDQQDELDIDTGVQVDKKYEEEIFDQLDHVSDPAPDKEEASAERPQESSRQETVNEETKSAEESGQTEEAYHPRDVAGSEKRIHTGPEQEDVADDRAADYDEAVHGPERIPRKICLFEVKCAVDGDSFTGIGLDISAGGLFVDSKDIFEVGKVVELEFRLFEDDEDPVRCRGAVTWYNQRPDPIKPDYPNGFGVRFIDMDATTIERVDAYLKADDETA